MVKKQYLSRNKYETVYEISPEINGWTGDESMEIINNLPTYHPDSI